MISPNKIQHVRAKSEDRVRCLRSECWMEENIRAALDFILRIVGTKFFKRNNY